MRCPKCNSESLKISRCRSINDSRSKRTRKCNDCGHSFTTIELNEDELKSLLSSSNASPIDQQLSLIDKKLNILAQAIIQMQAKSEKGIQPKKSKKHMTPAQQLKVFNEYICKDEDELAELPDAGDIKAWAELIVSLG